MVKLATAREARLYGPALAARRWEYINAGAYAVAALLLAAAFAAAALSGGGGGGARAGLAVAAAALAVVAAVNAHDLAAHLAGVDFRVGLVLRYDAQLGLVELLVPALHAAGCVLAVAGAALLINKHVAAESAMFAGAALWLAGSVLNACQVYERADGSAQLLQSGVQVPMLLGSLLFVVAGVLSLSRRRGDVGVGGGVPGVWWVCLCGSLLWAVGAAVNAGKVVVMHQSDAPRLEKLRGGAQERLSRERDARAPLNWS